MVYSVCCLSVYVCMSARLLVGMLVSLTRLHRFDSVPQVRPGLYSLRRVKLLFQWIEKVTAVGIKFYHSERVIFTSSQQSGQMVRSFLLSISSCLPRAPSVLASVWSISPVSQELVNQACLLNFFCYCCFVLFVCLLRLLGSVHRFNFCFSNVTQLFSFLFLYLHSYYHQSWRVGKREGIKGAVYVLKRNCWKPLPQVYNKIVLLNKAITKSKDFTDFKKKSKQEYQNDTSHKLILLFQRCSPNCSHVG